MASRRPAGTEGGTVDDAEIVATIGRLVGEEHELEGAHVGDGLGEAEQARLRALEVALDECWDLLRQRRAKRSAGEDPDAAAVRSENVVEGYQQ
jgi:hypothetical protein